MKSFTTLKLWLTKCINNSAISFIIAGGINTVLTYLLYLLFIKYMSYVVAYTLTYIVGIVLSYYLNSWFVFKVKVSFIKCMKFPLVYVVQYVAGTVLLYLLVDLLSIDERIAPALVLILTIPIVYFTSKKILVGKIA